MTEAEWLSDRVNSQRMIDHLKHLGLARTKTGKRRLRLYACGCARIDWDSLPGRVREAIEVAERFSDGLATKEELSASHASPADDVGILHTGRGLETRIIREAVTDNQPYWAARTASYMSGVDPSRQLQARVARCVFGNPFRPVTFLPEWRTPTVLALAQQMYDSRDFSAMPILADALEDAGCTDEAMLAHYRGPGPHVRGCHVIDALTGRS